MVIRFYRADPAHPLFSIIERINLGEKLPEINLQENLIHEVKAFTTRARADEYTEETIVIAQYLLGATIDETIKKAVAKNNEVPPSLQFLSPSHQEDHAPEQRFFQILDRIIVKPDTYLDLIELLYLCLRAGFEGKFYNQPNGKQELDQILEKIYQIIKHYRKDTDEILFIGTVQPQMMLAKKTFPWKLLTFALIALLVFSYGLTNLMLNRQATEVIGQLASLTSHNQHYNY